MSETVAGPEAGSEASFELADGRVLEYWEGGDPAGQPVVFHPGTPVTRLLGRWGHDAAIATGVRLVSISRRGYGGSTTPSAGHFDVIDGFWPEVLAGLLRIWGAPRSARGLAD